MAINASDMFDHHHIYQDQHSPEEPFPNAAAEVGPPGITFRTPCINAQLVQAQLSPCFF